MDSTSQTGRADAPTIILAVEPGSILAQESKQISRFSLRYVSVNHIADLIETRNRVRHGLLTPTIEGDVQRANGPPESTSDVSAPDKGRPLLGLSRGDRLLEKAAQNRNGSSPSHGETAETGDRFHKLLVPACRKEVQRCGIAIDDRLQGPRNARRLRVHRGPTSSQ